MKKIVKILCVTATLFSVYQLGRIDARTKHFKRIVECVKLTDISLQQFYGHKATIGHTMNHANAQNSHIYLRCIYRDLYE